MAWITFFCVLFHFSAAAQGSFYAEISSKEVKAGALFEVEFVVADMKGSFTAPDFTPFQRVAGPMQSSSFQSINGQVSQEYRYTYVLKAPEEGFFLLPEAELVAGDQVFYTEPIEIEVLPSDAPLLDDRQESHSEPSRLRQILKGKTIKRF